jgi:hypothetical protein
MRDRILITAERTNGVNGGAYRISGGYVLRDTWMTKLYLGYTKREAVRLFREQVRAASR